jgi:hypothetical protein
MFIGKQDRYISIDCRTIHKRIGFSLKIDRIQLQKTSEILPSLFGCHKKSLLMRLRRPDPA